MRLVQGSPMTHRTRDEMDPLTRAVSDTLDEYLVRHHSIFTSHTNPEDFMRWLGENGHEVRATPDAPTDPAPGLEVSADYERLSRRITFVNRVLAEYLQERPPGRLQTAIMADWVVTALADPMAWFPGDALAEAVARDAGWQPAPTASSERGSDD